MLKSLNLKLHKKEEEIRIDPKSFAGGGEGNLYHIAEPLSMRHRYVVKIYHPHKMTLIRQEKLRYLLENPPIELGTSQVNPSVIWVQDLVYSDEGDIIGLVMPFVRGEKLELLSTLKLPKNTESAWHRFALGTKDALNYRIRLCFNIAVALQQVHATGKYVLVDLKPDNIVIQPHGIISLVDMDSVEVVQGGKSLFDAKVATPEYTPPEHYISLDYDPTARQAWDRFSMAVIFYKLLLGIHPFAAGSKPPYDNCLTLEQKIEAGLFVHNPEQKGYLSIVPPPHYGFEQLPQGLKALFIQTFVDGHHDPEMRPTAEEWCVELLSTIDDPKLQSAFGHLALPISIENIKVHRRLPSELIQLQEYGIERAKKIIPDWFKNLDHLLGAPVIVKHPIPQDLVYLKKSNLHLGWIIFGLLVFAYNFAGRGLGRLLANILDFIGEIVEAFLQIFGIDDDLTMIVMLAFAVLFIWGMNRLSRIGLYRMTKEFREKTNIEKKLAAIYLEFNLIKYNLTDYGKRIDNIGTSKITEELVTESSRKLETLRERIKKHDPEAAAAIDAEKNAYTNLYYSFLQKAQQVPTLQIYLAESLSEIRKKLIAAKDDSVLWKETYTTLDNLIKNYQFEFKALKTKFNKEYEQIIDELHKDLNETEANISQLEVEKKAEFELNFSNKIPLEELENMQKQLNFKKNVISDLEYEKEKYKEVTLKNYLKLKK